MLLFIPINLKDELTTERYCSEGAYQDTLDVQSIYTFISIMYNELDT